MRSHSLKIAAGLICCFIAAQLHATETSWDKMLRLYSTAKSYAMDISVHMKMAKENDVVTYKGCVKQSAGNYYSSIQGVTTVYGPKYWVLVYESSKTMYFGRSNPDVQKQMFQSQQQFADSLLKLSAKPRLKSKNANEEIYVYDMKDGAYKSVEYTIQVSTGYMTRVVYNYRGEEEVSYEQVTIDYSSISVNQLIDDSWFSEKTYFNEKKGTTSGAGKFAGYTVIDQDAQLPTQ